MLAGTGVPVSTSAAAAPALVALYAVVVLETVESQDLPLWVGLLIAVATILATWVGSNLAGRRTVFTPIRRIGRLEALVFLLVPSIVMLATPQVVELDLNGTVVIDGALARILMAVTVFVVQVCLLVLVYVLVLSGLWSLGILLTRQLGTAIASTSGALSAVIPVMLGFVFFFLLNPGVWLSIANLDPWSFLGLIGFLMLLGGLFLGSRSQLDLDAVAEFDTQVELADAMPAGFPTDRWEVRTPAVCPLDTRQRSQLRLVAVLSRLVTAAVLAGVVFAVFLTLGFIVIGSTAIESWTKSAPQMLFSVTIGPTTHFISWQHVRIAAFLGAFSGFNYALVSATDGRLRQETRDTATRILRQACALRLLLLARADDAGPTPREPTPDQPVTPTPAEG